MFEIVRILREIILTSVNRKYLFLAPLIFSVSCEYAANLQSLVGPPRSGISIKNDLPVLNDSVNGPIKVSGKCHGGVQSFQVKYPLPEQEVVCDADNNWSVDVDLSKEPDGVVKVITDQVNPNTGSPIEFEFEKDTVPPSVDSISINGNTAWPTTLTNNRSVTVAFSSSDLHKVYLSEDSSCESGGSWAGTPVEFLLSNGDGDKSLFYRAQDKAGNKTACIAIGKTVHLDQTAPAITGLQDEDSVKGSQTWNWGCTDLNAPCTYSYVVSQDINALPNGVFANDTGATQALGNGTFYLAVQAKDKAGNLSSVKRVSVPLSSALPSLAIKDNTAIQGSSTVELVIGGDLSNYNILELSNAAACVGAVEVSQATPILWTLESGDGLKTFYYQFKNAQSERTSCSPLTIMIDQTPPVITGLAQDLVAKKSKTLTWGCTEDNGPCEYRYVIDKVANSLPTGEYGSETTATQGSGDGSYYIHIQARDAFGNESEVAHYRFEIDNTPPLVTVNSVTPTSGDYRTIFKFSISYSGTSEITLQPSDILIEGNSEGCVVSMTSNSTFRYIEVSQCSSLSTSLKFSIKANTARDVAGNLAGAGASSTVVNLKNPIIVSLTSDKNVEVVSGVSLPSTFGVSMSAVSPNDTIVQYSIVDAMTTAVSGLDHDLPLSGSITIPAGQKSALLPFNYFGALPTGQVKSLKVALTSLKNEGVAEIIVTSQQTVEKIFLSGLPLGRITNMSLTAIAHSCFVMDGDVYCWGENWFGQLGNGTNITATVPTKVISTEKFVKVIVSGESSQVINGETKPIGNTCALTVAGEMYCWGKEFSSSAFPVLIKPHSPSSGYRDIALGPEHHCALSSTGNIKCLGFGAAGARDGMKNGPYDKIIAGVDFTCGFKNDGVRCAGANTNRRLSDSTQTSLTSDASINYSWTKISVASKHSCGIQTNGKVGCWGSEGNNGQLGIGSISNMDRGVVFVSDEDTYKDIAVTDGTSCGVTTMGVLKCWGYSPLAANNTVIISRPQVLDAESKYTLLSAYRDRFCGVTESGLIRCFGPQSLNRIYSLRGVSSKIDEPTALDHSTKYQNVLEGSYNRCGMTVDNEIRCWGLYGYEGHAIPKTVPMLLDRGKKFKSIQIATTSFNHTVDPVCGITTDEDSNKLRCIGARAWGSSGQSVQNFSQPTGSYKDVAIGANTICAVNSVGEIKCWGDNNYGQLGNGTRTGALSLNPVTVTNSGPGKVEFESVYSGGLRYCAIAVNKSLWCWGRPETGQLTSEDRLVPVEIDPGFKVDHLTMGYEHTCMIGKNELDQVQVKCWGKNSAGELGTGDAVPYESPQVVLGLDGFEDITAGTRKTCGLKNSELYCWGQLQTNPTALVPEKLLSGHLFKKVSRQGNCGIDLNDNLKCWGDRKPDNWDFGDVGYNPFFLKFGY